MEPYDLCLEDYCNDCPEFDVAVYEEKFYLDNFMSDYQQQEKIIRKIKCKHAKRCNNMIKYLEKKGENK